MAPVLESYFVRGPDGEGDIDEEGRSLVCDEDDGVCGIECDDPGCGEWG